MLANMSAVKARVPFFGQLTITHLAEPHIRLCTANTCSTRAHIFDLLRFFERFASLISSLRLRTRSLVKSFALSALLAMRALLTRLCAVTVHTLFLAMQQIG
jgi:hypothetical protein